MTIAAGFNSEGGVVLCADTEVSLGGFKFSGTKLTAIDAFPSPKVVIAAAGDSDFAQFATQELRSRVVNGMSLDEVKRAFASVIKTTYAHIQKNPSFSGAGDTSNIDLLVGAWSDAGECKLWRNSRSVIVDVPRLHLAGIGQMVGQMMIDRFMPPPHAYTLTTAVFAAVVTLWQAKTYVQGCGGESHIIALTDRGRFHVIESTGAMQHAIEILEIQARDIIRGVFTGPPEYVEQEVQALLRQATSDVEQRFIIGQMNG